MNEITGWLVAYYQAYRIKIMDILAVLTGVSIIAAHLYAIIYFLVN
jgi:hypothetical protein